MLHLITNLIIKVCPGGSPPMASNLDPYFADIPSLEINHSSCQKHPQGQLSFFVTQGGPYLMPGYHL
ncbi:hypothetical protein GOBAR_DD00101 [Gossypium barbadense]|nr:hypothetical protein GOBAR_DD00101 [Gossypium barbadense]